MPRKSIWIAALVLLLSGIGGAGVYAQTNLLQDPGFEGDYTKNVGVGDNGSLNIPPAWSGWYITTPRNYSWQNLVPNGAPNTGGFKKSGNRSLAIGRGSATFTAAVFQTVPATAGTNYQASISVFIENVSERGSQVKVGIDPAGGSNPLDPGIVWGTATTVQTWTQASVSATAKGSAITMFIYMTQNWPNDPNSDYLDDASLTVGGAGGSAPPAPGSTAVPVVPTTPPLANFVSPQGAQPDGSIVHTVQSGDTIAAIAVAYGVSPQQIVEQNNLSGNGRFISPGQKLIIKPAPTPASNPGAAPTTDTSAQQANPAATSETSNPDVTTVPVVAANPTQETAPPTATQPPAPTLTPSQIPPSATPISVAALTTGTVCVLMFNDSTNPNRIQEAGEGLLPNGQITLKSDTSDVGAYTTDGKSEPHCFEGLSAGDYTAVATAPSGFGLTSPDQFRLHIEPGTRLDVMFGAAQGYIPPTLVPADTNGITNPTLNEDTPSNDSPLLKNIGLLVLGLAAVVLVGGIGVAVLLRRR